MNSFSGLTAPTADSMASHPATSSSVSATEPAESELKQVVDFLNRELRPQAGWSIEAEYPNCFRHIGSMPPNHYMRIVRGPSPEGPDAAPGEVVSHALVRPLIVKTQVGVFKIAAIGSVVTAERARGKGYSRATIESCLELSKKMGAEIAILWSNLFDFYAKLGFAPAGTETIFSIDRDLPRLEGLRMIRTPQVSPDAILRLFQQHSVHSFRTADDVRRHLAIPNSSVYTAWDGQGRLSAYAIEGKGADLSGCIHEWGGSTPALLSLFDFIRKDQKRDLLLMSPSIAQNLNRRLETAGCKRHQGPLGLMRVLNAPSIVDKLTRSIDLKMSGISRLTATGEESISADLVSGEHIEAANGATCSQLLFDSSRGSSNLGTGQSQPIIPIWFWGWDSV